MQVARLRHAAHRSVQTVIVVAVGLMAGWNAYICLRLRPDVPTLVINLAFWVVPMLALVAATGRLGRSVALGTAATFCLQRLHWLKWRYLEQTWTAADLRFFTEAANWALLWQYPEALAYLGAGASMLVLTWVLLSPGARASVTTRGAAGVMAVTLTGSVVHWRDLHPFDPFGFNTYGHFASLAYSASTLGYQPPQVTGSSDLFLTRAAALDPATDHAPDEGAAPPVTSPSRPDIVIWLQESAMDLGALDLPGADLPALRMYEPDARTRAHGRLRVHSWGGGTWLSEFALLSGLSHQDFGPAGNSVYYTVTPHLQYSLPRLLARHGYRSVALVGTPKTLYNAEAAQRDLGFDEVLNPLDFPEWGGKSLPAHFVSDEELGRYARQILARPARPPLLLFVLSMMQHGPYDSAHPIRFGLDRLGLRRDQAARLSDYATRMVATDVAALAFGARLLDGPRPAVFAYFGDHQPNLGQPITYRERLAQPQYLTSYMVKTNLTPPAAAGPAAPLDITYLGAIVLEAAGLPLDPLFDANRRMRRLCDGRLTDCPDQALTSSYRAHLYRDLVAARPR